MTGYSKGVNTSAELSKKKKRKKTRVNQVIQDILLVE